MRRLSRWQTVQVSRTRNSYEKLGPSAISITLNLFPSVCVSHIPWECVPNCWSVHAETTATKPSRPSILFLRLSILFYSCIFDSCIFHPCDLLPYFPLLHFHSRIFSAPPGTRFIGHVGFNYVFRNT